MTNISKTPPLSPTRAANKTVPANKQEPAKKYEFTDETIEVGDYTLYRIRANFKGFCQC
ncbi:hypothetical protein MNL09_03680 [Bartonella krasnovii]|nr:hypothetical protein MNL09_03680 [Bartonella krasnovii]